MVPLLIQMVLAVARMKIYNIFTMRILNLILNEVKPEVAWTN